MKKYTLSLLIAAIMSIAVAMSVGAAPAFAATCNGGGYSNVQTPFPTVAQGFVGVHINATSAAYQTGDFRSFVQLYITGGHSIEVGLISDGHGLQQYVESGGVFLYKVDADKFHQYIAEIDRTGTNTFTAEIDASPSFQINVPAGNIYAASVFESVDNQSSGTCNGYAFSYSSELPFNLNCAGSCSTGWSPSTWPKPQNVTTSSFNTISGP